MSNYITYSKQINLCSSSAKISNNPLNSFLYFDIPNLLKKEKHIMYSTISVIHAQIPISYYIINSSNNFLSLSTGDINLLEGNYNASTFKTMLLLLLPINYNLVLNNSTGKFTLSYITDFTINNNSTCYILMGFKINTSYTSSSNILIMPYPCNFLGINRIKIKSGTLATQNLDTNSNGHSDLLTTIPVDTQIYGLINYNNITNFKSIITQENIDNIDISITDENDNLIDFNGLDIYITLQIDTIRDQPIINNLLNQFYENS